jgi:hypothetical protein
MLLAYMCRLYSDTDCRAGVTRLNIHATLGHSMPLSLQPKQAIPTQQDKNLQKECCTEVTCREGELQRCNEFETLLQTPCAGLQINYRLPKTRTPTQRPAFDCKKTCCYRSDVGRTPPLIMVVAQHAVAKHRIKRQVASAISHIKALLDHAVGEFQ